MPTLTRLPLITREVNTDFKTIKNIGWSSLSFAIISWLQVDFFAIMNYAHMFDAIGRLWPSCHSGFGESRRTSKTSKSNVWKLGNRCWVMIFINYQTAALISQKAIPSHIPLWQFCFFYKNAVTLVAFNSQVRRVFLSLHLLIQSSNGVLGLGRWMLS